MVPDRLAAWARLPKDGAGPIGHGRARAAGRAGLRDQGRRYPERAFKPKRGGMKPSTDGKCPSGHSMVATKIWFWLSSRMAMWTAATSPQRPSKVPRPSASRAAKSCQRSSSTTTRRTRPMPLDPPPIRDQLGQCRHKWVFLFPLNSDPSALIASIVFP